MLRLQSFQPQKVKQSYSYKGRTTYPVVARISTPAAEKKATPKKAATPKKSSASTNSSKVTGKSQLVTLLKENKALAELNLTKKDFDVVIDSLFNTVKEEVSKGQRVQIIGFGSFEKKHREARKGRNPQTGSELDIAAKDVPRFSPAEKFKSLLK